MPYFLQHAGKGAGDQAHMTENAISGIQCRAGRWGRGLHQTQLAKLAQVSRSTIAAIESDDPTVKPASRKLVIDAFDAIGVRFARRGDVDLVCFHPVAYPNPA
jgi:DNA-binding XRE family transcriptional regulator